MKLATTIADFKGYAKTWAEAVRMFEGTGFRYLDFDFYSTIYPGSPFLADDWMKEVHDAAEEAARLGFTFVQAHAPSYNALNPAADPKTGMLALRRSIAACGELGITNLVIHSVHTPKYQYPDDRIPYFAASRAYYEALFPDMERYGVTVLVENIDRWNMSGRYYFSTGEELGSFLDECGHPLLKACWDVGHANIDGHDQYRSITALKKHLRALHIQDNYGAQDDHIMPLLGTLDIDSVMCGLKDIGYQGYFTFEALDYFSWSSGLHPRRRAASAPKTEYLRLSPDLRRKAEALLYETGKYILTQYHCFEE